MVPVRRVNGSTLPGSGVACTCGKSAKQTIVSPRAKKRFERPAVAKTELVLVFSMMFPFPARLILQLEGPEEVKNLAGKGPPPDSNPL